MQEVSFGEEKGRDLLECHPLLFRPLRGRQRGPGPEVGVRWLAGVWARIGAQGSPEVEQFQKRGGAGCAESRFSWLAAPCLPAAAPGNWLFYLVLLLADVSDISGFLSAFHRPSAGLIQAARQLLSDERAPLRQKLLADLLHTISENIAAETRAEDPPWFEGRGVLGVGGLAWSRRRVETTRSHPSSRARGSPAPSALSPGTGLFISSLWKSVCNIKFSTLTTVSV